MSILVGPETRLVVQGITGREGDFHSRAMQAYGTRIVAGVTPGKGGQTALDGSVPVYDTVAEAVRETGANTSCIFVPAAGAPDAVMEAAAAGIATIFCITEGIPALDMIPAVEMVKRAGARLIGPNCPGATSPGSAKVGIIPGSIHREGRVGVVSRSGTLTYEAVQAMTDAGVGQSTCVGIGGDPIIGTTFLDVLQLLRRGRRDRRDRPHRRDRRRRRGDGRGMGGGAPRATSPRSPSSPAGPRPRASGWATPGRSSRAEPGRQRPRSPRSRPPGSASPAPRPSCRLSCATRATAADPAMLHSDIRYLFDYDRWATNLVFDAAAGIDEATWAAPNAIGERGLGGILVHALGAHQRWRHGLSGGSEPLPDAGGRAAARPSRSCARPGRTNGSALDAWLATAR